MASSFDSFEAAGSPVNPGSSVIHLCMSVKRTVSGSVSGYLSVSAMAMSSKLSQPNVGGMSTPEKDLTQRAQRSQRKDGGIKPAATTASVIEFLGVVLVPIRDFHNDVGGAIGNGLAAEARLWRDAGSFVELVQFGVGSFVARLQALMNNDVAGRAGADAAAGVVQAGFDAFGNVEDASRKAVVAVWNLLRVDLDGFAAGKKGDLVFLRGGFVFDFFDVWIAAAHRLFPQFRHRLAESEERFLASRRMAHNSVMCFNLGELAAFEGR